MNGPPPPEILKLVEDRFSQLRVSASEEGKADLDVAQLFVTSELLSRSLTPEIIPILSKIDHLNIPDDFDGLCPLMAQIFFQIARTHKAKNTNMASAKHEVNLGPYDSINFVDLVSSSDEVFGKGNIPDFLPPDLLSGMRYPQGMEDIIFYHMAIESEHLANEFQKASNASAARNHPLSPLCIDRIKRKASSKKYRLKKKKELEQKLVSQKKRNKKKSPIHG